MGTRQSPTWRWAAVLTAALVCGCGQGASGLRSWPADPPAERLWPGVAPGSEGLTAPETSEDRSERPPRDRKTQHVTVPTLTFYLPPASRATGAAVVVAPGGGYSHLAIDKEGHRVARWLESVGVAGIVLKYRTEPVDMPSRLLDAKRAVRLVRSRAATLGVRPDRIGFMGFSAGAHLAATLATNYDEGDPDAADPLDRVSCRLDFFVPVYGGPSPGDLEKITLHTPPAFVIYSGDDAVVGEGGVRLWEALGKAGVPSELHVYARGGHGYGMGRPGSPVATWPMLFANWLEDRPGQRHNYTRSLQRLCVSHPAKGPVRVDGKLDEWGELPISCTWPVASARWQGPQDCSFSLGSRHDAGFVYLGVRTRDDDVMVEPDTKPWSQDGMYFRIDARPAPERAAERGEPFRDFLVLSVSPGPKPDEPVFPEKNHMPPGLEVACIRLDDGLACEVAIPAAYLDGLQSGRWQQFHLAFRAYDRDRGQGSPVYVSWYPLTHSGSSSQIGTFRRGK